MTMKKLKTTAGFALGLLIAVAGCADLTVPNENDPAREQVLQTASDIESLIAGSFNSWYTGLYYYHHTQWLSNASFQSSSTAANFGNIDLSPIPRVAVINDPAYADYDETVERPWVRSYRALAAVADGLRTLDADPSMGETLGAENEQRIRAFGKMVQAIGHATLAVFYDQAFIIDENTELVDASGAAVTQTAVPYNEVMDAAIGYFDEAIDLASGASWQIPAAWMSVDVSASELVELLHSWRAIFRASLPRTPDEPVEWTAVLADLDAGLSETFIFNADASGWYNGAFDIIGGPNGWGSESYWIIGMADTSGNYQRWLDMPTADKTAWFGAAQDDDPFLIHTPDQRFPQGSTLADQKANAGTKFVIPTIAEWRYDVADHFTNPSRGTWRWSYYYNPVGWNYWFSIDFDVPLISMTELNLLRAEAILETTGDEAAAAALIDFTRTAAGLDASGDGNGACVPKLPDEACGDVFEMLKWEKRIELKAIGLFGIGWYWDGRRWGDLYKGTPLQLPMPAGDADVLQLERYTFGGANASPPSAAAGSSYNWPGEGS